VLAQAHQRGSHRTRGQEHGHGQGQAHGRGYPGADRVGHQHRERGGHREHPGLMPAGETQGAHQGPADQGLEDELGDARRHGHGHRHQHGPAPSTRQQAGQEEHRGHHETRHQVSEPGQVVQHPPLPAETTLDPGVDPPVERSRPALSRDQYP